SQGQDYQKTGFLAPARPDERRCPQLVADILVGVTDVTARMQGAGAGLAGAALIAAREAEQDRIAAEACGADPTLHCEVVALYEGGEYKLYRYHRFDDVRLVFSPGDQAAFFGGDPDNFNFPRYDLDCAFLRLYENGKPAATPDFLAWSNAPPQAGEPVFVSGNPGATERRLTVAQLQSLRDVALPLLTVETAELRGRLVELGEQGPAMRRLVASDLFETENTYKVLAGRLAALRDPAFMAARAKDETDLKARLAADPKLAAAIGDPWSQIAAAEQVYARQFVVWHELETGAGAGSDLYR